MQSSGGVANCQSSRRRPITTLLSGPAAGVQGAMQVAAQIGVQDFITFDMGGTSTEVCLVQDGEPGRRTEMSVAGLPVRVASLDVHTVGAGGGSIARVDGGGFLCVGPQSAGANPGPACYGRGGTAPTVSDAGVIVGHLSPEGLLGGRMPLRTDLAEAALERLGWVDLDRRASTEDRAEGVLRIATSHLVEAVRLVTVGRGVDPRGFALLAYGGAGPVHAAAVAQALGIRRVIVPPEPGLLCASGLLAAEPQADFARTQPVGLVEGCEAQLATSMARLEREADAATADEGSGERTIERRLDMRYQGQSHALVVELPDGELGADGLRRRFEDQHRLAYGYVADGEPIEVLTLRLTIRWPAESLRTARLARGDGDPGRALVGHRRVQWEGGRRSTPVLYRDRLRAGDRLQGPAIIEQMDSTTVVPPGAQVEVHDLGALLVGFGG
jgi:N-methylhydantoinase A